MKRYVHILQYFLTPFMENKKSIVKKTVQKHYMHLYNLMLSTR